MASDLEKDNQLDKKNSDQKHGSSRHNSAGSNFDPNNFKKNFENRNKKKDILECNIVTCSQRLFHGQVVSIKFMAIDGMVMIMPGHENANFLILPGKIILNRKEFNLNFYNGYGCLEIYDDVVNIFALPIFSGSSYKSIEKDAKDLDQDLLNIWKNS